MVLIFRFVGALDKRLVIDNLMRNNILESLNFENILFLTLPRIESNKSTLT